MSSAHPLIAEFQRAGQAQVFAFFDELAPDAQAHLLAEAAEIDLAEMDRLNRTLVAQSGAAAVVNLSGLVPAPYEPLVGGDAVAWERAKRAGEEALRAGRVAAFTVAGGQGTRLGYDGPKGTFPVSPVLGKTLFQVFAEKLLLEPKLITDAEQVNLAIETAVLRPAKPREQDSLLNFIAEQRRYYSANPCDADKLLNIGQHRSTAKISGPEHAAWTSLARVLLNLNETITRY
jgi:hypothetical protein